MQNENSTTNGPGAANAAPLDSAPNASFLDLLPLADEPEDWVVEGMVNSSGLYIIAGEPKRSKKTLTCIWLSLCVAQGKPFLGRRTSRRPVVYTFLEDGQRRIARRLRAF